MNSNIKNLLELRDFLNTLPFLVLSEPVRISREESPEEYVTSVTVLDADFYYNPSDPEDCGPLDVLKEAHGEDFIAEDYQIANKKGTIYLNTSAEPLPFGFDMPDTDRDFQNELLRNGRS